MEQHQRQDTPGCAQQGPQPAACATRKEACQAPWSTPRDAQQPASNKFACACREGGLPSTSEQPETPQLPPDVGLVFSAQAQGAVYIVGRSTVVARSGSPWLRR